MMNHSHTAHAKRVSNDPAVHWCRRCGAIRVNAGPWLWHQDLKRKKGSEGPTPPGPRRSEELL